MGPVHRRLAAETRLTRAFLGVSAVITLATALLLVVQAEAIAQTVSRAFLHGATLHDLRGWLTLLVLAVVGRSALAWGQEWVAHRSASSVISDLRGRVLRAVARRGVDSGDRAAEVATVATTGIDALDGYFARYLPTLVQASIIPLVVLVSIGSADWVSGVVILCTLPLVPVFMALIGWYTERDTRRRWRTLGVLSGHFLDVVSGLTTLKIFGRSRAQAEALRESGEAYRKATTRTLRVAFLSALALELLSAVSVAVVAVGIGLRLIDGHLALQTGLFVLVLAPEAYAPLRAVGASFHSSAEGVAAADDAFALLDSATPSSESAPAPSVREHGIDVLAVSHVFAGRTEQALSRTSLRLERGVIVAVAGPSGCGKSTLVSVLAGQRRPTAGEVLVGGVDLGDVALEEWRRQVAWLPQRPHLFQGTVADNVRLGDPQASDDDVNEALATAGLPPSMLRAGQTVAEGGAGLSAGQRQRVAIARLLLRVRRRDIGLVLLDEPTAHLDGATEAAVLSGLLEAVRDRCVLLVAHRPALLAAADQVVRLAAGSPDIVVDRGAA